MERRLKRLGHVSRMDLERLPKKMLWGITKEKTIS